jgi:putative heme-binding domain-containing protein
MHAYILCAALLILLAPVGLGQSQPRAQPPRKDVNVASTEPLTPEQERQQFRLPPGFEAQLVAAEPQIRKPMNIAFDARGRLWVTDTVEYPFPAREGTKPRDSVKILEDFDENGRARKVTTFADGLNIPIGILPLPDARSALVFSIPNIYRLTDTDGDGKADRREVLYSSFGFGDTHGMTNAFTWGFDGWIYACHGFANTSAVKAGDGSTLQMHSGNVYRMKPDGSRIEQITWGQVNPFGLAFDPLGNLYSADCHSRPIYQLLRGARYPSFGKPHDGIGFGPEMMTHDHGSTAIAGIVCCAADHFPREYQGRLFVGNVTTNRINHDRIDWRGSTPRAVPQPDFLVSGDPWFRPVDLKLGLDGALYVADFYNRIIGHYEVPLTHPGRDRERGRIWRIVSKGQPGDAAPPVPLDRTDWTRASVEELVKALDHGNLAVRVTAANQLVERGGAPGVKAVLAVVQGKASPTQRLHALWVLERCGALDEKTLAAVARNDDPAVRVQAMRILAERAPLTAAERSLVLAVLAGVHPDEQRAAADAAGRHPAPENLRPLLDRLHRTPADDTHLKHVVRMALRDNLRPASVWKRLPLERWTDADAAAVSDAALGVPSRESAVYLVGFLRKGIGSMEQTVRIVRHVARHGGDEQRRDLLALVRRTDFGSPDLGHRYARLRAYEEGTQERGGTLEAEARAWAEELSPQLLASANSADRLNGIELAGRLRLAAAEGQLREIAASSKLSEKHRVAALNSLAAIDAKKHIASIGRVLADAGEPPALREQAAGVLARLNNAEAHEQLLAALSTAPARLQSAIALGLAASPAGAEKLLEAVAAGKASARLLQERPVELRLQESKLPDLTSRLAKLTAGLPPADQRLQDLFGQRRAGFTSARTDTAQGLKVFEKHCAACHQLANKGAKVGPQLDGIGTRGLDRLLEDLLDPNRNVDQAFRSTTLALRSGQVINGLLLREEGEVLVLADAQGKEVRVPKNSVDVRSISAVSPMPANLIEQIDEKDFYHLLAYLLQQRPREIKAP